MGNERAPETHRFCLPPGTVVEDWRVVGCYGHGAYGIVYRAVRIGQESAGPVALKVALYPWDPRFMREVALLSLIHHPSVPLLYGHGFWKHPAGMVFPFIVMQWIEGTPLYEWAREHNPSARRMLQVLAQVASALQATHAASAVHRDVKGENVLVRRSDGRAMLTDFGSGNYQAAARLTWQPMPPGTPAYQSPEAGLFQIRSVRSSDSHYMAGPADDVFALGVTAYRLVTGEYPPSPEPQVGEDGTWHMEDAKVRPPHELNLQVEPVLSALILRMLSMAPAARGTAGELAEVLEAATGCAGPTTDLPPPEGEPERTSVLPRIHEEQRASERGNWVHALKGRPWHTVAIAGVILLVWASFAVHVRREGASGRVQAAADKARPDAGTTDLGDAAPTTPRASAHVPARQEAIAQDSPPEPFPGQLRTDAKGRCSGQEQIPINGACWLDLRPKDTEACEQSGYVFFKGRCYAPALAPRRKPQPTSNPTDPQ